MLMHGIDWFHCQIYVEFLHEILKGREKKYENSWLFLHSLDPYCLRGILGSFSGFCLTVFMNCRNFLEMSGNSPFSGHVVILVEYLFGASLQLSNTFQEFC